VPAAAVIPAPIAYIKFAAVKKLVVGFQRENGRSVRRKAYEYCTKTGLALPSGRAVVAFTGRCGDAGSVTLNKLECSKQAFCLEYVSME